MYKHIKLMHNELRYQAKTHTNLKSYEKEKKLKNYASSPQFLFFFVENNKTEKNKNKQGHAYGKGNNI
jgi:hypothetical protein